LSFVKKRGRSHPASRDRGTPDSVEPLSFERHLLKLGLSRDEWQQLKELVLENSHGCMLPIPPALARHRVALLVSEYRRTGRERVLEEAAVLLVGSRESVWLALEKS
jgi:hypothetical protein